jgi:hypothetical protein
LFARFLKRLGEGEGERGEGRRGEGRGEIQIRTYSLLMVEHKGI